MNKKHPLPPQKKRCLKRERERRAFIYYANLATENRVVCLHFALFVAPQIHSTICINMISH